MDALARERADGKLIDSLNGRHQEQHVRLHVVNGKEVRGSLKHIRMAPYPQKKRRRRKNDADQEVDGEGPMLEVAELLTSCAK